MPIIMLTGNTDEAVARDALRRGASITSRKRSILRGSGGW